MEVNSVTGEKVSENHLKFLNCVFLADNPPRLFQIRNQCGFSVRHSAQLRQRLLSLGYIKEKLVRLSGRGGGKRLISLTEKGLSRIKQS